VQLVLGLPADLGFPSLRIEKDGLAAHLPIDYNHPETLLGAIRDFLERPYGQHV